MATLHRPARLKLTKTEMEAQIQYLQGLLTENQHIAFVQVDPINHPKDWIIVAAREGHGEVDNISAMVAAVTHRQCGDRRFLRGWAYDTPGSITHDLGQALGGIELYVGTI